jgi:hypothetical protein
MHKANIFFDSYSDLIGGPRSSVCPAPTLLPGFVNAQSASLALPVSDRGWIPIGEKSSSFVLVFRKIPASVLILQNSYLLFGNSK